MMKKKYQIIGLLVLMVCSIIYDFQKPEVQEKEVISLSYVILEGEFLTNGKYEFEGQKTIQDLIDEIGVSSKANLQSLNTDKIVEDESRIYLPPINDHAISLNHATKEELMTLQGIGEKTALKIMDYRSQQPFESIEDIMNVSGIGEKTYLRLRENLCL